MTTCALPSNLSPSQIYPQYACPPEKGSGFYQRLKARMEDFKVHLLVMNGLCPATIYNYQKIASKVLREIGDVLPGHDQIKRYIVWLHEQRYSYHHLTNTMRAIEAYMDLVGNPIRFGRPKKPKPITKDPLTEAEISVILSACRTIRERAMLSVLAYTGIRNQELCDLRLKDVDLAENIVHVVSGKGSKGRMAFMSGECSKVLQGYLAEHPRSEKDYLFTTIRRKPPKQYTPWALRKLVSTVVSRTTCRKDVHPHLFRHSLASNMLARGANLLTIKDQLGHSSIQTTMIYIRSRRHRVQSEYHMFTPSYL